MGNFVNFVDQNIHRNRESATKSTQYNQFLLTFMLRTDPGTDTNNVTRKVFTIKMATRNQNGSFYIGFIKYYSYNKYRLVSLAVQMNIAIAIYL